MAAAFDTFFKAKEVTVRKTEIISDQITQGPFWIRGKRFYRLLFAGEEGQWMKCRFMTFMRLSVTSNKSWNAEIVSFLYFAWIYFSFLVCLTSLNETAKLQKCIFASIWFWFRDRSLLFLFCVALFCGLSPATCTTSFCYLFLLALYFFSQRRKKNFSASTFALSLRPIVRNALHMNAARVTQQPNKTVDRTQIETWDEVPIFLEVLKSPEISIYSSNCFIHPLTPRAANRQF